MPEDKKSNFFFLWVIMITGGVIAGLGCWKAPELLFNFCDWVVNF